MAEVWSGIPLRRIRGPICSTTNPGRCYRLREHVFDECLVIHESDHVHIAVQHGDDGKRCRVQHILARCSTVSRLSTKRWQNAILVLSRMAIRAILAVLRDVVWRNHAILAHTRTYCGRRAPFKVPGVSRSAPVIKSALLQPFGLDHEGNRTALRSSTQLKLACSSLLISSSSSIVPTLLFSIKQHSFLTVLSSVVPLHFPASA